MTSNNKRLIITALVFFLIVNTQYYWEGKLGPVFAFGGNSETNHITIRLIKSQAISISLDGTKREVIPLQWPYYQGKVTPVSVNPISLGLKHPKVSLPVYIQRHALRRLSERTGISPGLLHQSVVDCFRDKEQIRNLTQGSSSLVEFKIYDQKLGYLVCVVHEELIVIRTFLFLTNDGTPEGKKLAELTRGSFLTSNTWESIRFLALSNSGLRIARP